MSGLKYSDRMKLERIMVALERIADALEAGRTPGSDEEAICWNHGRNAHTDRGGWVCSLCGRPCGVPAGWEGEG